MQKIPSLESIFFNKKKGNQCKMFVIFIPIRRSKNKAPNAKY